MSLQTSFTSKSLSTVTPASFAGLDFWLDATDTTTIESSGTSVVSWRNKGSISFSATPSLGTPTTGSTWNDLNYISCPIGARLAFTSTFNSSSEQTWFVVARGLNQVTITNVTCRFVTNAANDYFGFRRSTTTVSGVFQVVIARAGTVLVSTQPTSAATGDPRPGDPFGTVASYCGINDANYPTPTNAVTVSGSAPLSLPESLTAASYTTASSVYTIGDTGNSTGWDFFEIIRYSRALNDRERQAVEGYIAWKYKMRTATEENFIPTSLSNCVLWLDGGYASEFASNFTGTTSAVTSWLDKSGNSNHATVGSGTYAAGGGTSGYISDLRFLDPISSGYLSCPLSLGSTQPVTLFSVASGGTFNVNRTIIGLNVDPLTSGSNICLETTSSLRYNLTGRTADTSGNQNSIIPVAGRWDILSAYWSPGSSQLFCRGAGMPASATAPPSLRSGSTAIIGNFNPSGTGGSWDGNIGEIIVYNRTLTENERRLVENYLSNKWQIQLVSTTQYLHPYRSLIPQQRRFTPPDLSNYQILTWIDAADPSTFTLSGANIATITDKAQTPSTLTLGGTVGYDTTYMNGRPSFNLSNGRIIANTLATSVTSNSATVVFVGYLLNNPAANTLAAISLNANSAGTAARWRISEYNTSSTRNVHTNSTSQTVQVAPAVYTGTPYIWAAGLGPTSNTTRRFSVYFNDGSGTNFTFANSSTSTVSTFTHLRLGGDPSIGATSNTYPGCIGEMIMFNNLLSFSELRRIAGYLCQKWDIQGTYSQLSYFKPQGGGNTPGGLDASFLGSTLMIWLDATEPYGARYQPGPTLNSPIVRWENKSTETISPNVFGLPFVPFVGSATYTTDDIYPAIYFNGASYMRTVGSNNISTTTFSIVVVGRTTQSTGLQRMFIDVRGSNSWRAHYIDAQVTTGRMGATYDLNGGVYKETATYSSASTRTGIYILNQPGIANPTCFLNGLSVPITVGAGTVSSANMTTTDGVRLYLGAWVGTDVNLTVTDYFTGYIYEVIVTDAVLTTQQRQILEGILAWKWGIVDLLPATHPFKKIAP